MKVLIADDELLTRTVMARTVSNAGHQVSLAADGNELLERFSSEQPEVLIVDWRMPGIDGVKAIREIRTRPGGAEAFIVLATGVSNDPETAEALEAGIDDYLVKPVSIARLRVILKLTEARLRKRQGLSGPVPFSGSLGPSAEDALSVLGDVVLVDEGGKIVHATRSCDHRSLHELVGSSIETLMADGYSVFANASLVARESGRGQKFAFRRDTETENWEVHCIFRDGVFVGLVLWRVAAALSFAKAV